MADVELTRRQEDAILPAKLWMASLYGCLGFLLPYFNLILAHFGYNGWQIGIISAIRPLAAALCGPVWAGFADIYGKHRAILISCLVLSSMARATLGIQAHPFWYLIALVLGVECLASPIPSLSDAAVMSAASTDGCYGSCRMWACLTWNTAGVISSMLMRVSHESAVFAAYAAASLLAVISACRLDMSLIPSRQPTCTTPASVAVHSQAASDPEALLLVECGHGHAQDCSRSEVLEPLLEACTAALAAAGTATHDKPVTLGLNRVLNDNFGTPEGVSIEQGAPPGCQASEVPAADAHPTAAPSKGTFSDKLVTLLRDRRVITFLAKAMLMGVCIGAIDGYLFVYLDRLAAPPMLLGACLAVVCSAEIPVFAYSGHILRALGYHGALQAALAAYCLRLAAYSSLPLLPSLWMVLPVELLHGVTFGVAWCAGVNHSKSVAPAGLEGTVQSLFSGVYCGLGKGLGGLFAGILFHLYGGMLMFRAFFVAAVAFWGVIVAVERVPAL